VTASHVLVMAKAPRPGRVKTRLCPPLTEVEAAELAEAALSDTLEAVSRCGADRRLLALDGPPGPWLPSGFEVFPQRGDGLDERLAAAWDHADGPGLQIGMDTPQVTGALLDDSLGRLDGLCTTAVLGPATDGGWWAIGLRKPDASVFLGVPMSSPDTRRAQERRLRALGHDPVMLPPLRDVDTAADAAAVAALAPCSCFARAWRQMRW
jgi:uncharacterized protein